MASRSAPLLRAIMRLQRIILASYACAASWPIKLDIQAFNPDLQPCNSCNSYGSGEQRSCWPTMTAMIHNLAGVGCDYVERARHRVPMLNQAIETIEPYVRPLSQVAELYIDAAFSALSPEGVAPDVRMSPSKREGLVECKLQRVSGTFDLRQMSQTPQERGLLHRARCTGTKLLIRMETFADNLGPAGMGSDEGMGLGQLRRCDSDSNISSCSASLISSSIDDDESERGECLTTVELIPRAIILPVLLQMQVARLVVDRASAFASTTTQFGYSLLQNGAVHCARRSLQGVCRVAARITLCRRAAYLLNDFLGYAPGVRQVVIFALPDDEETEDSQPGNEGGTGCYTN